MEVYQAISLMIAFGALIVTLIGVVVTIVIALNQSKKK
ncbi:putative holin-like toxin [Paenibacillus jiagnxiensis]